MTVDKRGEALDKLLEPIVWSMSSSIRARQNLVHSRFDAVAKVEPFLNEEELKRVEKWRKKEKHSGLWD
jgi:hypothetical protein